MSLSSQILAEKSAAGLHLDKWKRKPYAHQVTGVKLLVDNKYFGLLDEMGVGKSYQVVNAACELFETGEIDTVLVISPAAVRGVWANKEFGEIKKHSWQPSCVVEYHNPVKVVWSEPFKDGVGVKPLDWCVTNYEFLRNEDHRKKLIGLLKGRRTLMVLDESSFVKSRAASQTKACVEIGRQAARRVILNGTPIANNPLDLWSQSYFLSPLILPYKNFYHFRADYAILGGYQNRQIIKFKNLDRLQAYIAPHVIRREKKDCLDLPPKIYLTPVEVPLSAENWERYKEMRDEMVVWLDKNPSLAAQAGVKIMRLSQITSGFLGGFVKMDDECEDCSRAFDDAHSRAPDGGKFKDRCPKHADRDEYPQAEEIGREKLDFLRSWVKEKLEEEPALKLIVWCRFRQELERVAADMADILPTFRLYGQSKKEREESIAKFSHASDGEPAMLCGQVQAGGLGLNLIQAWVTVYLSNDFNLLTRLQSEDRVHRPGQTRNVLVLDVLATGPQGQKTIDHKVVKRLREKHDLANWTVQAWKRELLEEEAA